MTAVLAMEEPRVAVSAAPYVGPRPYEEAERSLFFGRQREGELLVNKILASPITVLFALSGTGKTSLLKTLVIPELRTLETKVVYFDDWTHPPLPSLTSAVATQLGLGPASKEGVLDLAQQLKLRSEESLVLVLDQFEQFFLRHPGAVESFGRELGALARSSADCHIVLVIREEYLGRLDAFRPHLLTVAVARYRLAALAGKAARSALEDPPRLCNGRLHEQLLSRLIVDLRLGNAAVGVADEGVDGEAISLPIMQIICEQLWASVADQPSPTMTEELYEELGGRHGIVNRYVQAAVQELSEGQRLDMARVLNLLAPKAGVKMAYPVEVLAQQLDLPRSTLRGLLNRLDQRRIVRLRENDVVELTHDAFTDVLRGFIDEELKALERRELRQKRRTLFILALMGTLCVLFGIEVHLRMEQGEVLKNLASSDCTAIARAVHELRAEADKDSWVRRVVLPFTPPPMAALFDGLRNNPAAASCENNRRRAFDIDASQAAGGFSLAYNDDGGSAAATGFNAVPQVRKEVVANLWNRLSTRLWEESRLPLPESINIEADDRLPAGSFVLRFGERIVARRALPKQRSKVAVLVTNLPAGGDEELEAVSERAGLQRRGIEPLSTNAASYAFAEPWTAPLWRVEEERIRFHRGTDSDGFSVEVVPGLEAAMAIEAVEALASQPELYSTEDLTRARVAARQRLAPCLVASALARFENCSATAKDGDGCEQQARDRLVARLTAALREADHRRSPAMLTGLLDRLADVPADAPEAQPRALIDWLVEDDGQALPPRALSLTGPGVGKDCTPGFSIVDAWDERAQRLEADELPVRVQLGAGLVDTVAPRSTLAPALHDAIYRLRYELIGRYGVVTPGVRFRAEDWQTDRFAVHLLGEGDSRSLPVEVPSGSGAFEPIIAQLTAKLREVPATFVSVDSGVATAVYFSELNTWLYEHFSRNDLKLLLRRIIVATAEDASTGSRRSIDWSGWVLRSLPFWTQVCAERDGECLLENLLKTERARVSRPPVSANVLLDRGIAALARGEAREAIGLFQRALKANAQQATEAFLSTFAAGAEQSLMTRVDGLCAVQPPGSSSIWGAREEHDDYDRAQIDAAADQADAAGDPKRRARLRLCSLMYQLSPTDAAVNADRIREFVRTNTADRQAWTPQERFWLAYRWMDANARLRTVRKSDREATQRLILESFGTAPDRALGPPTDSAFSALQSLCGKAGSERCYRDLVNVSDQLELGPFALWELANSIGPLDAYASLDGIQQVRHILDKVAREGLGSAGTAYNRIQLELDRKQTEVDRLSFHQSDGANLLQVLEDERQAIQRVPTLSPQERTELESRTFSMILGVLESTGRAEEALRRYLEREGPPGSNPPPPTQTVGFYLETGRMQEAASLADRWLEQHPPLTTAGTASTSSKDAADLENQGNVLFQSALAHLMLDDDDYATSAQRLLLWVDHHYRDYVRLILYWRLTQRGQKLASDGKKQESEQLLSRAGRLLEDRLREIPNEETPKQRLAEGDLAPWREDLTRYFLDPILEHRARLFAPLEDEATFAASDLVHGGQSYYSFRCEAFFYDALLQSITGDAATHEARYRAGLQRLVDERCYGMYELAMAQWLLEPKVKH